MNARGQYLYKSAWSIRGPRFAGPAGAGDVRYLWTLSHPRLFGGWSRLDFLPFVVGDTVIFSHTVRLFCLHATACRGLAALIWESCDRRMLGRLTMALRVAVRAACGPANRV